MSHVVIDLKKIDLYVESLIDDDRSSKWLSKVLKREAIARRSWLTPSLITTSNDEHVRRAIENGEGVFEIGFSDDMKSETRFVMDWLAELEQRDPRLFSKLDRITWKQAVEHSTRWHETLARRAEKLANETIPFDDDCPVMFTHDDGMKWVWLKTDKARDDEGRIMGHCVGQGGYDRLRHDAGVFSLRDVEGCPHVTMELKGGEVLQKKMKGNKDISYKYSSYVMEFHEFMMPKFMMKRKIVGIDHLVWWNGDEEWFLDGVCHRTDGPARVFSNIKKEWWLFGSLHREDGPAIIMNDGTNLWYENGVLVKRVSKNMEQWFDENMRLHREDGPAVIRADGMKEWWNKGVFLQKKNDLIIFEEPEVLSP